MIGRPLEWLLLAPVFLYRILISPLLPPRCRFYPSCSSYAVQAIRKYGPIVGLWRSVRRVSRCHPWNEGGYDPP